MTSWFFRRVQAADYTWSADCRDGGGDGDGDDGDYYRNHGDHDVGDSWDSNDGAHDDEYASDLPAIECNNRCNIALRFLSPTFSPVSKNFTLSVMNIVYLYHLQT